MRATLWLCALPAALSLLGCETGLGDALDDLRAAAPTACKDYCEDKLICEWPYATGAFENDAFSSAVRRCVVDCAFTIGEGAYAVESGAEGPEYVAHVAGGAIADALACGLAVGAFRCTEGAGEGADTHAFGAVVASMCADAEACLAELGIDQHLAWTPTTEGGGTCAATGTQALDAEFFLP